ncbi:MAG: hypothetical protein AB8B79_20080 [Granulosicoccus sp.]
MTKRCSRIQLPPMLRYVVYLTCILIVNACGGGLGGSGDGGKSTSSIIVPLPDSFDSPYLFRSIPVRFMARFPGSLAAGNYSGTVESSAFDQLTTTVSGLIERKLEIGLLQLQLEANWDLMTEHCSATPVDSACDLSATQFTSIYTSAMASWEYLLRASIELERSGLKEVPAAKLDDIENIVTAKIGADLVVDNGALTLASSGSYRYEIVTTTDLGFGNTIYTARWSEDRVITFISLAELDASSVESLQSSISYKPGDSSVNNSILATSYEEDTRLERQLNLNQVTNSGELQIETQHTQISGSTREDAYSIGNAGDSGGYLKSELISEDASDTITADFLRESFTGDARIESQSICRSGVSETDCDLEDRWEVLTPQDPILSQYFLTQTELAQLETRLKPFNLEIEGVSESMDVLVLIRRENLSISLSSAGIIIKIPGLGTIDLTSNSVTSEIPDGSVDSSNGLFAEYADSILCRVNKAMIEDQITYRSFCAGSTEEIENSLVIGESFVEGELVIEWQANASIRVMED